MIFSFDFWRYPESADKDSIFAGVFAASLAFSVSDPRDFRFNVYFPEFYVDYILPIGLPFSLGLTLRPLAPDIFGIGIRPAYHINFGIPNLNVYIMYSVTFNLTNRLGILAYGTQIGVRYNLFSLFHIALETGPEMRSLHLGAAIRLN